MFFYMLFTYTLVYLHVFAHALYLCVIAA